MAPRLTLKQEAFVEAYLRLQNGGKAYKEAYDTTGKMSDNMAYVGAWENLRKPKIQEAIKVRKEAIQASNEVCTIEELAERWTEEIRFDLGELFDERGYFKSPKDLSPKTRRLLQGVKVRETIVKQEGSQTIIERCVEYKLPDRQKARIELGKRIGFYPAEKRELTGNVSVTLAFTDEDRALARKVIDQGIKKLMEAEQRHPPNAPPRLLPPGDAGCKGGCCSNAKVCLGSKSGKER